MDNFKWKIEKRYSELDALLLNLEKKYKNLPKLPGKYVI